MIPINIGKIIVLSMVVLGKVESGSSSWRPDILDDDLLDLNSSDVQDELNSRR